MAAILAVADDYDLGMPKKKSARLREAPERAPRGGARRLLDLAWDLDTSTPFEAWTHPWRSGVAAAQLAVRVVHSELVAPHPTLRMMMGIWSPIYEDIQQYRREIQTTIPDARHARWLRAGCLIMEAMLANSAAGGALYGEFLWAARPDVELDGDRIARLLLDARVKDALGHAPKVEAAFREAWSAGKFRVAYLLAEASRGIR